MSPVIIAAVVLAAFVAVILVVSAILKHVFPLEKREP